MKITPGFWRQRNGDKVEIISIDHAQKEGFQCLGRGSGGHGRTWNLEGIYNPSVTGQSGIDLVAPWEEPKLRPWKAEEVPVGALYRRKNGKVPDMILGVLPDHEFPIRFASRIKAGWLDGETLEGAFDSREHSTDGGKTWHPCGVMEGGAK